MGEFWAFGRGWTGNFWLEIFECGSEKGWSRKHTGKRVTSWRIKFWGNLAVLRWFVKRIFLEELDFGLFWSFGRGSTWEVGGGGTVYVSTCAFGGILGVGLGWGEWWEWGHLNRERFTGRQWWGASGLGERTTVTGERFRWKNNCHWRGIWWKNSH
jgi:hypothetical protein